MKINPILPKAFSGKIKRLDRAVAAGMRAAAEQVKADFEQTTATWEHAVTFTITPDGEGFVVGTDDTIWAMVDQGTRPHVIVAHGKALRFTAGGTPKTAPGRIRAVGGSRGSAVVIRPRVNHPGTEARGFTGAIAKRWLRRVAPIVQAAIREALR